MPRHNRMFNPRATLATNSIERIDLEILHLERRRCVAKAANGIEASDEQMAELIERWGEEAVEAIREDLRWLSSHKRAIFDCTYLHPSLAAMGYHQDLIRDAMRWIV